MTSKQKMLTVFLILVIIVSLGGVFFVNRKSISYRLLKIDFEPIHEIVVNTSIDPLELIRSTNAAELDYPKIDTAAVGKKEFFYVAYDSYGNDKTFILEINIVSQEEPILTLTTDQVELATDEDFDPLFYIKECYDETDGELTPEIEGCDALDGPGSYLIRYSIQDSDGHQSEAVLTVTIKKAPEPEIEQPIQQFPKEQEEAPLPAPQPELPIQETSPENSGTKEWIFERGDGNGGYSYEDALNACIAYGKSSGRSTFDCLPFTDENGELAGYRLQ